MTALHYAELIYYITGGPILAIAAVFGLRQIYIAKKSVMISSRRDAYRLSSQQIHYYLTEIIPLQNELNRKFNERGFSDLGDRVRVDVQEDGLRLSINHSDDKIMEFLGHEDDLSLVLKTLNHIESFSHPFVSELASEKIAYVSLGVTYTNSIKKLIPFMLIAGDDYYQCTKRLFGIWYKRREVEQLSQKKMELSEQLDKLNGDTVLVPIGDKEV